MANNWETTVKITVPKGTNGWQQTGRVRVNGRDYKFPIGVQTQLPKPVAEYVQALIDQDKSIEEAKKRNPFSSPHQVFVTDSEGNPVWEDRTLWTALAAICPEALTDPDVKILYDAEKTEIAVSEFANNTDIEVVYFPNVTTIRRQAFSGCTNLRVAILPKVKGFYTAHAFAQCTSLERVIAPNATMFSDGTFEECEALTTVDTAMVTDISTAAFSGCKNLSKLHFPKLSRFSATTILFSNCVSLETLILAKEDAIVQIRRNAEEFFINTPIASGTGYIYVPSALIEDYKVATNWSTYAAQFRAIEDYPEICDPEWDGHAGDVVIPAGKSLTLESGAALVDGNAAPNQMLVTDVDGKVQWVERTHYDTPSYVYSFSPSIESGAEERTIDGGLIKFKLGERIRISHKNGTVEVPLASANTKLFLFGGSDINGGSLYAMLTETEDTDVYRLTIYTSGNFRAKVQPTFEYDYGGLKTIDEKYIPDTIQRVGGDVQLTSPSGTVYKLTVADDGTLSATAVTE